MATRMNLFSRERRHGAVAVAVGVCVAAIVVAVPPAAAQNITKEEVRRTLETGKCPRNLKAVRETSWVAHCGEEYYQMTPEMSACREDANKLNRQIKAYNRHVRRCKGVGARSNEGMGRRAGGSGRYSGGTSRSSGGYGGTGPSPQSCVSVGPPPQYWCDFGGWNITNNCGRPVQVHFTFRQRNTGKWVTTHSNLKVGGKALICTMSNVGHRIAGMSYAGGSAPESVPVDDTPSRPTLAEDINSAETRSRYCRPLGGELQFRRCFDCPNDRGECWDMNDARRICGEQYRTYQQTGKRPTIQYYKACINAGWWPPG